MKVQDVPQDFGMAGDLQEVCYAVDEKGDYVLVPSLGWEPKNIANGQAWQVIREQMRQALEAVHAGRASPLTYYMARHQMDSALLAKYTGISRLMVWYHSKPSGFRRLKPELMRRYAQVFDIPPESLAVVPNATETAPHQP
jgi:hypothetical protein